MYLPLQDSTLFKKGPSTVSLYLTLSGLRVVFRWHTFYKSPDMEKAYLAWLTVPFLENTYKFINE